MEGWREGERRINKEGGERNGRDREPFNLRCTNCVVTFGY